MKPLPLQLEPAPPCLLHVIYGEGKASVLLVDNLKVLRNCDKVPLSSLLQRKKTFCLHSLLTGQVLQPVFGPFPVCPPLSELWGAQLDTALQGQPERC